MIHKNGFLLKLCITVLTCAGLIRSPPTMYTQSFNVPDGAAPAQAVAAVLNAAQQ